MYIKIIVVSVETKTEIVLCSVWLRGNPNFAK